MSLKHVSIYSNQTDKSAEYKINSAIENADEDTDINFSLMLENAVTVGGASDTRYTLIIYEYEVIQILDEYDDEGV